MVLTPFGTQAVLSGRRSQRHHRLLHPVPVNRIQRWCCTCQSNKLTKAHHTNAQSITHASLESSPDTDYTAKVSEISNGPVQFWATSTESLGNSWWRRLRKKNVDQGADEICEDIGGSPNGGEEDCPHLDTCPISLSLATGCIVGGLSDSSHGVSKCRLYE